MVDCMVAGTFVLTLEVRAADDNIAGGEAALERFN